MLLGWMHVDHSQVLTSLRRTGMVYNVEQFPTLVNGDRISVGGNRITVRSVWHQETSGVLTADRDQLRSLGCSDQVSE